MAKGESSKLKVTANRTTAGNVAQRILQQMNRENPAIRMISSPMIHYMHRPVDDDNVIGVDVTILTEKAPKENPQLSLECDLRRSSANNSVAVDFRGQYTTQRQPITITGQALDDGFGRINMVQLAYN